MGIFSRREPNERDINEDVERGKNLSGPTSSDASTLKGRRRW